jgi:hypothetical protein
MPPSPLTLRSANRLPSRWTWALCAALAWRSLRRVTRSWTLLIGGLYLAGAAEALATCGDWLAHPVAGHEAAAAGDQQASVGAARADVDRSPVPAERRSPCQGPGCRPLPEVPVSPPPPPSSPTDDQQACDGRVSDASDLLSGAFWPGADAAPRAGFYPRLEDPPRRLTGIDA